MRPRRLLHEESDGSACLDGAQDLIQQGSAVVPAAQLFAASGPRLAGAGDIEHDGRSGPGLVPGVSVDDLRERFLKQKALAWSHMSEAQHWVALRLPESTLSKA